MSVQCLHIDKGFGYIEFCDERDALKLLDVKPHELVLKDRNMIVSQFIQKSKPTKKKHLSTCKQQEDTTTDQESLINNLPADLLTNIFANLCLRDLCIVERGIC